VGNIPVLWEPYERAQAQEAAVRSYNAKAISGAYAACFFFAFLAILGSAGLASGTIIPSTAITTTPTARDLGSGMYEDAVSYTITQIINAGGIIIGDKFFDYFGVVTTNSIDAFAPDADTIKITAVYISGDYGFKVNGGWSAPAGQTSDSTINFRANILDEYVAHGYAFKDSKLWISAFGLSNNTNAGAVSVSENIYPTPLKQGAIANEFAYYISETNQQTLDSATFAPITQIWVVKDVIAYGGIGTVGAVHLSEFYQTFSQVPEPGMLALLSFGGMAVAVFAWRKRRS